ncbi:MAG: TIGR04076 family protein [archaeon]|nr:TIGR04076 family protein [archaeon]
MSKLIIEVSEIKGNCPVYKKTDKIVIEGPEIDLKETDAQTFRKSLIKNLSLRYGVCPVNLGLTMGEDPDHAYIQCLDPGGPYTEGGTVIFKCY